MKNRKPCGFTIVELLVVMAIIGVLSVVAISSFSGSQKKQALDAAARELMADMLYIQSKNMNGASAYRIYIDKTNNRYSILADGVNSERTVYLPKGIVFYGNTISDIWFSNDGTLRQHITDGNDYVRLTISGDSSQNRYIIVQLVTGRIRISNTSS